MSEEIEGAIEYLSTPSENCKVSVMEHISQVLVRVADFGNDRPNDYFEPFSYIIKEERQKAEASEADALLALHEKTGPDFVKIAQNENMNITRLFARSKLTAEGEEEEEEKEDTPNEEEEKHEEEEAQNEGEVPNIPGDMRFVADAGIGLTDREAFLLQQAIQKLVRTKPLTTARFWGKVIGTENNYYICEVEFNDGERPHGEANNEEEEKAEDPENKIPEAPIEEDSGPNLFSYFVCTHLGGKWTLLPDLLPKQIVASRSIKQMFTGNLEAEVQAPPGRFQGTEKELLRCFIARIVHSCTLAPKGQYNPEEEPEEDQPLESNAPIAADEEWVGKPISGMDGFVHRTPCLLPQGRTEFWAPEAEEEEKEPVVEKGPPILRPITLDEPIEGGIPSWSMRILKGTSKKFWLRSNTWPGLSVVSSETGDKMVMMYFGWGQKATAPLEWPPLPEPKKKPVPVEEEEEEEDKGEHGEEEQGIEKEEGEAVARDAGDNDAASEATYGTYDSTYDGSAA